MNKKNSRRAFLTKGIQLGLGLPMLSHGLISCSSSPETQEASEQNAAKKLNILILGGTSFLGPHQIAYALKRGHSITTFTRGKTEPSIYKALFQNVTALTGDRADDLTALENGRWDAVIDNSGRRTAWTKSSAALLKDKADIYLYTSSTGVYYPYLNENVTEDATVLLEEPENIEDEDMKLEYWYGVMKATSEIAAREEFGADRTIVVRPTYMIGPADKSNRFIHWPVRLAKGGEIMIPGKADDPVQYIDVRDTAEWMIRLIEEKKTGTFNAVGPQQAQTMRAFVEEASRAFDVDTSFVQIDDYNFLKDHELFHLVPWIMPEGNNRGSALINNEKGIAAGLSFRDLKGTIKDTHDWWYSEALSNEKRNEFEQDSATALAREQAILEDWKAF